MRHASKYILWRDSYNWNTCKLKNKEFGQFISSYLRSSHKLVANLNSEWGSGKTNFLKRLYVDLAENNHPVIYIDAWESDYSKHPLSVVSAELFQQLTSILVNDNEHLGKVTDCFNRVLGFARPIARILSALQPDSEYQQISNVLEAVPDLPNQQISNDLVSEGKTLIETVKDAHFEQVEAMRGLKNQLELVASILNSVYDLKIPVVVLVDELDRCRPNYAIEFLEVIKHFFEIDNFVFLCASDTKQLCASIKTIYGNEFDSQTYLKRFFERTIALPEPKIADYIKARGLKIDNQPNLILHPCLDDEVLRMTLLSETVAFLASGYKSGISLRDIDQVLAKFEAILAYFERSTKTHINIVVLITSLVMNQKGDSNYTAPKLDGDYEFKISSHHIRDIIRDQISLSRTVFAKDEYGIGGLIFQHRAPKEMLALQQQGPVNPVNMNFKNSYGLLISLFNEKREQYFLMDKYTNLVELSGFVF